jgi:hypothetical protein
MVMVWLKTIADTLRVKLEPIGFEVFIAENLSERIGEQSLGPCSIGIGCGGIEYGTNGLADASLAIGVGLTIPAIGEYAPNQIGLGVATELVKAIYCIASTNRTIGTPTDAEIEYHGENERTKGIYWCGIEIQFTELTFESRESLDLAVGRIAGMLALADGGSGSLPVSESHEIEKITVELTGPNEGGVIIE